MGNHGAETVAYTHDAGWRQASVCINGTSNCYAQALGYDALNQPVQWSFGNTLLQTWNYQSQTARLQVLRVGTSASLGNNLHREYSYDAVGNIAGITNAFAPAQSFAYDQRDRLTSWTRGGATQSFNYDTIGNIISKGGTSQTYGSNGNGTGTGPHRIVTSGAGMNYGYDLNGNMTSGPGRSLSWNVENLPTSATNAGVSEQYSYNADGERLTRTSGGDTTVYLEGMVDSFIGVHYKLLIRDPKLHTHVMLRAAATRHTSANDLLEPHGLPLDAVDVLAATIRYSIAADSKHMGSAYASAPALDDLLSAGVLCHHGFTS